MATSVATSTSEVQESNCRSQTSFTLASYRRTKASSSPAGLSWKSVAYSSSHLDACGIDGYRLGGVIARGPELAGPDSVLRPRLSVLIAHP